MNGYYNPSYPQLHTMRQDVVRVNGENGARAYNLPPNSSVLLMDENAPLVWLCVSDGAGYKTVTPYEIKPYEPEKPVDVSELVSRIEKIEERLNEQSNVGAVKPQQNEKQYLTITANNPQLA